MFTLNKALKKIHNNNTVVGWIIFLYYLEMFNLQFYPTVYLFRRQTGSSHSHSPSFQNSGGTKTQKEKRKKKVIHTVESGEKSIRKYLTRTKPKTMLKLETNTHNEHQEQFPQTEYSQGTSGETQKNREKPEAIHSSTSATKQHIYQYSDQEKFISRK